MIDKAKSIDLSSDIIRDIPNRNNQFISISQSANVLVEYYTATDSNGNIYSDFHSRVLE